MRARETVSVPGTMTGVRQAVDALAAWSDREALPDRERRRLLTTLDEVLSNVVRHGLQGRPGAIEITLSRDDHLVQAEVADEAKPFNPLLAPAPDTSGSVEARRPGGLGIALVRALSDEVSYERRGTQNRLTLTWRLTDEATEH